MTLDAEGGKRALARIQDRLEHSDDLSGAYAKLVIEQAQRNASSRPTPQAPMVAAGLILQGANILGPAGGAPQEVAIGAEFGSTIYRQFGPRNERGYWLLPAGEDPVVLAAMDRALDVLMQDAIDRGP